MPEWKDERRLDICQARAVLRWRLADRREYLDMIEKEQGIKARQKLEADMTEQHRIKGEWM